MSKIKRNKQAKPAKNSKQTGNPNNTVKADSAKLLNAFEGSNFHCGELRVSRCISLLPLFPSLSLLPLLMIVLRFRGTPHIIYMTATCGPVGMNWRPIAWPLVQKWCSQTMNGCWWTSIGRTQWSKSEKGELATSCLGAKVSLLLDSTICVLQSLQHFQLLPSISEFTTFRNSTSFQLPH